MCKCYYVLCSPAVQLVDCCSYLSVLLVLPSTICWVAQCFAFTAGCLLMLGNLPTSKPQVKPRTLSLRCLPSLMTWSSARGSCRPAHATASQPSQGQATGSSRRGRGRVRVRGKCWPCMGGLVGLGPPATEPAALQASLTMKGPTEPIMAVTHCTAWRLLGCELRSRKGAVRHPSWTVFPLVCRVQHALLLFIASTKPCPAHLLLTAANYTVSSFKVFDLLIQPQRLTSIQLTVPAHAASPCTQCCRRERLLLDLSRLTRERPSFKLRVRRTDVVAGVLGALARCGGRGGGAATVLYQPLACTFEGEQALALADEHEGRWRCILQRRQVDLFHGPNVCTLRGHDMQQIHNRFAIASVSGTA